MRTTSDPAATELELLRSSSLSKVIYKEIKQIILSGALGPGDKLNEKALAERFGTSRGPVREALQALHAAGLVEMIPNRGAFIQKITKHEAVEIYDVRAGLFGTACRLLAERIDDETIAELRSLLAQMDAARAKKDFDTYYPLNIAFHTLIVKSCGNRTLARHYFNLVSLLGLFRARGLVHGGGLEKSNSEHKAIFEALDNRDPVAAFEAAYAHVQCGKARIALSGDGPASAARSRMSQKSPYDG